MPPSRSLYVKIVKTAKIWQTKLIFILTNIKLILTNWSTQRQPDSERNIIFEISKPVRVRIKVQMIDFGLKRNYKKLFSGKSFFSDDQSSLPAVKTAEIITRSKVAPEPETFDLFADIQAKIGSMNILEDVLSIMDRECSPRVNRAPVSVISDDDFSSRQFSDVVESDHIDRNSLGESIVIFSQSINNFPFFIN